MEATNSKKFIDILKSPFVILYNIVTYALVGIKFLGFDFWADLYNGTSYRVSRTYEATKQAFMADEEKIYERTKKKPKKEKVYKYSPKLLAKLEENKSIEKKEVKMISTSSKPVFFQ